MHLCYDTSRMEFDVHALIWDAENEAHIWVRHQLTPEEVEDAVTQRLWSLLPGSMRQPGMW